MTQESAPAATRGWRDEIHPMPETAGHRPKTGADTYYILYFAEFTGSGVMGPMRRARYAELHEAAARALEMRRAGGQRPVEIRDQQDRLITCELMGWKLPTLTRPSAAPEGARTRSIA